MSETALLESERIADRFSHLAGLSRRIAHDFDNILTGVVGFAELTLAQTPSESPNHKYLSEILRVCEIGVSFTQRLHLFHRCGQRCPVPTDAATIVNQELERIRARSAPAISVTATIAPALPRVLIEGELLRLVLAQLLENAYEACDASGAIHVSVRTIEILPEMAQEWFGAVKPGLHLAIDVADLGRGMPSEIRSRLFVEPFFTTKPKHRGLGLPIAFRILHAHNGGLRLESPTAKGCIARVVLPVVTSMESQNGSDRAE